MKYRKELKAVLHSDKIHVIVFVIIFSQADVLHSAKSLDRKKPAFCSENNILWIFMEKDYS